ncbi:hypothetical protein NQZ68_003697 [Dissostichus eleginoides]|nr:hypothetical protein NQZ68_003697 [Dissostichus eleginoides]
MLLAKPNGMPPFHTVTYTRSAHTNIHTHKTAVTEATKANRDMTEPSNGLYYLPIIYLWTGGVKCDVLASLAPPVHLSGERLGWTLLVCMVSDFRRGHLEVSWRSPSEGQVSSSPYSMAVNRKHRGNSAVAIITVATSDWPSYSCSASHRRHPKVPRRHRSSGRTTHRQAIYSLECISTHSIHPHMFVSLSGVLSKDKDRL